MTWTEVVVPVPSPAGTDATMTANMLNGTHIGQYLHSADGWKTSANKFGGARDYPNLVRTDALLHHSKITMITHRKDGIVNFRTEASQGFFGPNDAVTVRTV
jgi:hypothetical protein